MSAVRTLLAVALATALLGATLPVVEEARADRTATRLEAEIDSVERAARRLLAREDPVASGRPAGRTVTVSLPAGSFADAPVRYLSFGGAASEGRPANESDSANENGSRPLDTTLTPTPPTAGATPTTRDAVYRVGSRPPRRAELDFQLQVRDRLVLGPGRHRLRLSLVRTVDGVRIRIRPLSDAG